MFIDKEALPPPEEGTPYQHQNFALPVVGPEHAGAVVRNMEACQVLVTALLYPDISAMTLLPSGNKSQATPPNAFSLTVFATLLSIIKDHPMNYFLLERLNILSYAIERLDSYHQELQVCSVNTCWLLSLRPLLSDDYLSSMLSLYVFG